MLPQSAWLLAKSFVVALAIVMVKAVSVKMRLDRLLQASWLILLPLALLNLIITYVIFVK